MAVYNVGYDFNPGDKVYILDGKTVQSGTCLQVSISLVKNKDGDLVTNITYLTLIDCDESTAQSAPSNTFATASDAFVALEAALNLPC